MAPYRRAAPNRHCGSARQASAAAGTRRRTRSPVHSTRRLGIGDHGTREQETHVDVYQGTPTSG